MGVEEEQGGVRRLKKSGVLFCVRSIMQCCGRPVDVAAAWVPFFPCVGGRQAARFLIRCGGGGRRARRQRRRCRGDCSRRQWRRLRRRQQRRL